MRSARLEQQPIYPPSWQAIPSGENLLESVAPMCNELSARMFGYHLVKLGGLSAAIPLVQCPIRHQVALGLNDDVCAISSPTNKLPLQENSVDAFLMAFELDFARDPHQILRELDRSITANGMVMIVGFNPLSLSGVIRYSPLYRKHPLKQARFFTSVRVKDWLQLLHYEIVEERCFYHRSVFSRWRMPYHAKLQPFFTRYMVWSGSVYCLLAKKRTIPMTLDRPKWRRKPRFVPVQAGRVISPASPVVRPHAARE